MVGEYIIPCAVSVVATLIDAEIFGDVVVMVCKNIPYTLLLGYFRELPLMVIVTLPLLLPMNITQTFLVTTALVLSS